MPEQSTDTSVRTRSQHKQSFKEAATAAGIKPATFTSLCDHDFDSFEALQEMQDDDMSLLGITRGQLRLLTKWRMSLCKEQEQQGPIPEAGTSQMSSNSKDKVTTQSLQKDSEVQALLSSLKDSVPGNQLFNGISNPIVLDNVRESWDETKLTGKPLFIPDFVNSLTGGNLDYNESQVVRQGSTQLVLRSTRAKPLPEQVSLPQWISANAKIMTRLISDGKLSSPDQLLGYLQYISDFGDYAQTCTLESLMIYDQEYRRKQAQLDRKWGDEDVHLSNFYLQRKSRPERRPQQAYRPNNRPSRPPRLLDSTGTEICRNYNNSGCYREHCQYAHVCLICKDKHPKHKHTAPA